MQVKTLDKKITKQELLWLGKFGDDYTARNHSAGLLASSIAFFSKVLSRTSKIESVLEFGANIGINIQALRLLLPQAELSALEINNKAVNQLKKIKNLKIYPQSILEFFPDYKRDFVFTRGLLVHLDPNSLSRAYDIIYKSARKYLCIAEYFNPTPIEVLYHGQENALVKRDFAGELLDRYKKLKLVDYGFLYHRDNNFPQDDISWFLMEKC